MNPIVLDTSSYLFFTFLFSLPFIGTAILYCLTKLLKFKHYSLKKAFLIILLSTISFILISIFITFALHYLYGPGAESRYTSGIISFITFITQTIVIKEVFKESTSRTILVSFLTTLCTVLILFLFPLITLLLDE